MVSPSGHVAARPERPSEPSPTKLHTHLSVCDVNPEDGHGAEGWGATVLGLNLQGPCAVPIVRDAAQGVQGADGALEPDLSRVCIHVEHAGRLRTRDRVVHQVVGCLCVQVCGLSTGRGAAGLPGHAVSRLSCPVTRGSWANETGPDPQSGLEPGEKLSVCPTVSQHPARPPHLCPPSHAQNYWKQVLLKNKSWDTRWQV